LAGIIAEDDVCRAMLEFGTGLRQLSVKDIMSPQVFSCSPDDAAGVAQEIMRDLHLGRLPVTDKLGRPVGVLWMDALGLSGRSPALRSHAS
jgi:CBS domain-containing protein